MKTKKKKKYLKKLVEAMTLSMETQKASKGDAQELEEIDYSIQRSVVEEDVRQAFGQCQEKPPPQVYFTHMAVQMRLVRSQISKLNQGNAIARRIAKAIELHNEHQLQMEKMRE